ncbi:MAG: AraC family transcriptional regulator [Clostridia bacterium]|nr:AraC family transcriptional regulator [Clostridia bacterium]
MNRLKKDAKYYFTNELTFKTPLDNVHYFVMRNYEIGMHKQDFFEINIIVRGNGVHYIEGNLVDASVGDVFIVPPDVEHGYTGGEGFDVFHILLNNRFMQKNLADLQMINGFSMLFNVEPIMRARTNKPLHLKLNRVQFKSIESLLMERIDQKNYLSAEDSMLSMGTVYIIITKLCGIYVENNSLEKKDAEVKDTAFMRSLALIHERYREKLTLEELAREARLSKSTYVRKFIYICKTTPAEYITRKRIEVAENLLKTSNSSLLEIAEAVGFYDAAHFSRTFKKLKGISPYEYRKKNV